MGFIMAEANGRVFTEDKIFGINKLAKEMIAKEGKDKVVNSTVGALLDDDGNLVVMSSVIDVLKSLTPEDYAEYAPIAGTPDFLDAVKKAVFGSYVPEGYVEAVATPGGTGALRNTIQNYTKRGDSVVTSDWFWGPYTTITTELERKLETYTLFDENYNFNNKAFDAKVKEVLDKQDQTVVILNTPAHNPTGYTLTDEDWDNALASLKDAVSKPNKKAVLLVDIAYIDFAGDEEAYRSFFPKLNNLPENILVVIAFSMSKSYTMYGMRGGAMVCLTPNKEIADEFKTANSFSNRGTWSNGTRSAMVALSRIYSDPDLYKKVVEQRAGFRNLLIERGKAFTEAAEKAGLKMCPYDAGFFATIPCENPEAVGKELQKEGIFCVPLGKGLRLSVASVPKDKCAMIPERMAAAIKKVNG